MAQRPIRGRVLAALAALAGAALIAWALLPEPVPVETRRVRRGDLALVVRDDGVTRIRERYVVAAPLAGRLARIALHAGDPVTADETPVATIEPIEPPLLDPRAEAEARSRLDAARGVQAYAEQQIHRAEVDVEYTTADLERCRKAFPSGAVTHEQLDAAERAWRTAGEQLEQAEQGFKVAVHLVALAEAAFRRIARGDAAEPLADRRLEIRAPVDGRVLRVFREDAGPVETGGQILEVGDPGNLEAVIDLVSEDAVKVRPGDLCAITAWGGDHPLAGHVRLVEPRGFTKVSPLGVEEQRVNVLVDIDVPAADRAALGDGFRVEAAITVGKAHGALIVPLAALFRRDGREQAYVAVDGRARLVTVETGRRGDREAEVLAGLAEGDEVIVYPSDKVTPGGPIAPAPPRE
jgi:HlyD family secretion protein